MSPLTIVIVAGLICALAIGFALGVWTEHRRVQRRMQDEHEEIWG